MVRTAAFLIGIERRIVVDLNLEIAVSRLQPPPIRDLPGRGKFKRTGEAYGGEFAPAWQVTDWWRLQAGYSYLQIQIHHDTALDPNQEGRSPHHQFTLRSVLDLPGNVQFDSVVRYVETLPAMNIPSYVALDLH